MMSEAIEGGAGQQVVAKDLGPLLEGAIAGDDQGAGLVPVGNDVVQILSGLRGQGLQAKVIKNEQVHGQEFGQEAAVSTAGPGGVQIGEETLGAPGEDFQLPFQGFDGQGVGEMTFADAAGAG